MSEHPHASAQQQDGLRRRSELVALRRHIMTVLTLDALEGADPLRSELLAIARALSEREDRLTGDGLG